MFDIIEYQTLVRQTHSKRDLFMILDKVCRMREDKQITNVEYEEIKDFINERMAQVY